MAVLLGGFIEKSDHFELLAPVRLNNVCFTLVENNQNKVSDFLRKLNDSRKVFMTPTEYNGKLGIRASFVNWQTNSLDVEVVISVMNKTIDNMDLGLIV